MSTQAGPVQQRITQKLSDAFAPAHLEVVNESYMHSVPKGSETHFKVLVVSDKFDSVATIERHRLVNTCLAEEIGNPVHALSISAKTPKQWNGKQLEASPACRGGFGK